MCADPMRGTPLSQDLDRGDGFQKGMNIILTYNFYRSAKTLQGGGWGGIRPTTDDQPRTVMRNPMRDPMRDIDLMVLGDVAASTPLPSTTREHRIQFASRTREPASRLLPLIARTPNFEAEFVLKHFCTLCATLCAGPLISQDLDLRAGRRLRKGHITNNF